MNLRRIAALAAALALTAAGASAQSPTLMRLRAGAPLSDRFRVDSSGALVAYGFMRDVGNTTGCAAQHPTGGGAGTFFFWHPCRGSLRFGRVPVGQTSWDDANMDDFTFAGGNQVVASGYGAFAYGDQVTASSTVGVGFGSGVVVSGTAGFSAGASNVCSGFACTAIGYTVRAGGQGSVALGYRTTANNDNSVTIGYRGSNNGHIGTIVLAGVVNPVSQTDSVRAQADGEFRLRAPGGIALRTSFASNSSAGVGGNTGCDLPAGSGTFSCSSSRTIKENFGVVHGEDVLLRIRDTPVTTWSYIAEGTQILHLGPVAEDFRQAFGLGVGSNSIGMGDIDGVNFAGVQALEQRTTRLAAELERTSAAAQAAIAARDARIAELEGRLARLEALIHPPR
jgi:trimeric autotransporter adhesin